VIIIKKHKGLGDTIAAITKATGLDKLVTEDCGCNKRQEAWNSPDLLINKIFYGTEQDIKVLRRKSEISGEEA
tara:strand:- start:25 stop:243 length:219 start_codon:yes stop_codon:yes gene_type:complete